MKKFKIGTPTAGIILGSIMVALGVLVMLIGFWRTLILACLFGIGYFVGAVDNMGEFIREKANKIIPDKSAQPIDIKSEIAREQEEKSGSVGAPFSGEVSSEADDPDDENNA